MQTYLQRTPQWLWVAMAVLALAPLGAAKVARCANLWSHTYHLRVYGNVIAWQIATPPDAAAPYQELELTAPTPRQAVIVVSKLLRDFTTLPTVQIHTVSADAVKLPALFFHAGRAILPVLRGGSDQVRVYCFATAGDLNKFLRTAPAALSGGEDLSSRHYPFYLDFWDRHCQGFWYHTLMSGSKGDASHYTFFKRYGLCVNAADCFPGVAARATRDHIGFLFNRFFNMSAWTCNVCPQAADQGDPDTNYYHPGYLGDVPYAPNPIQQLQITQMMNYLKQFTHDQYLVSLTDPYGETGPHHEQYLGLTQRGPYSRADFVHYLRKIRHLTLRQLGRRWYGNARRFQSWTDVQFPRVRGFYGWKAGQSQELAGLWKTRLDSFAAGVKAGVYRTHYNDARWLVYHQPGTQYINAGSGYDRPPGWMRCKFSVAPSLGRAGREIYLTICPFNNAPRNDPDRVYLNGRLLGRITFGGGNWNEWGQFDVTSRLQPRDNVLAVYTRQGMINGPVFLTLRHAALNFPTPFVHLNARLYDEREWVANMNARANARAMEYLRSIMPNQPIKVMAFDSMTDIMQPFLRKLGAYGHMTGEGAFFHPWYKRFGYLRGLPASGESGSTPGNLAQLKNLYFDATFEGLNAVDYFWDVEDVLKHPLQAAWYRQNVPYLQLMGRFDLRKPQIAVACSFRVDRMNLGLPSDTSHYNDDPGRGDLLQSHYSWVYCSARDIRRGLVNSYKVILDDNFCDLHPRDVKALAAWVKRGGTVILNQKSGRNTYRKRDAWPIDALTGCTATLRPQIGLVTFVQHPPILRGYAGRTFRNHGAVIDYQGYNYFHNSIALKPRVPGIQVVARYQDGADAIVLRHLGRGRVVVFGSAFYRHSHDNGKGYFVGSPLEIAFYRALFTSLGVAPVIQSSASRLWAERFVSNSGSTEMLVLGDGSDTKPVHDASAVWRLSFTPQRVFDPVTGKTLPAVIHGHAVLIKHLDLEPKAMRYYAVELTNWSALKAVKHWLFRQSQLWHAVTLPARKIPAWSATSPTYALLGRFWVKQFFSQAAAKQAMSPTFRRDQSWRAVIPADWASQGLRTGTNVWAVYRKTFTLPAAWLTGLRAVWPLWYPWPLDNSGPDEIEINGLPVIKNNQPIGNGRALLRVLKPGRNRFVMLCRGRQWDGDGGILRVFRLERVPAGKVLTLRRAWTIYTSMTQTHISNLPAAGRWIMARKMVRIPQRYRGDTVWIQADNPHASHMAVVSVNGMLRYAGIMNPIRPLLVNVTPDIRFGQTNDIAVGSGHWSDWLSWHPNTYGPTSVRLIFSPASRAAAGAPTP